MDRDFSRIVWLFQQKWSRKLSEEERKEFEELLQEEDMQGMYGEITRGSFVSQKLEDYRQYPTDRAYRHFLTECRPRRRVGRRIMVVSAVAAMLVVCLGVAFLWQQRVEPPELAVVQEMIMPGSQKAVLRLSSGEYLKIEGDSAKVEENNGVQIQYSNGRVVYRGGDQEQRLVYNELMVPLAGECFVILDDGTKVWINSASKLKYPVKFVGKERKVFLEGEAYFDVIKGSTPFVVATDLGDVRVLGTSFDVKAYPEEENVWTTLVSGKVSFLGSETVLLEPGQQVLAQKDGKLMKREVDVEEYVGWKDGLFVFKNQRLEEIMRTISRWYNIQVHFQHVFLKDVLFTGNLKRYDQVHVFLDLLRTTNELNYTITGNTVNLYK